MSKHQEHDPKKAGDEGKEPVGDNIGIVPEDAGGSKPGDKHPTVTPPPPAPPTPIVPPVNPLAPPPPAPDTPPEPVPLTPPNPSHKK